MDFIYNLDYAILDFIQSIRTAAGDWFFPLITKLGDGGVFWIILAIVLLIIPKTRKIGLTMGIALAIEAIICNVIIKPLVNRTRPYDYYDVAIKLLVKAPTDPSFPSGHTGASFACAGALFFAKSKLWIPATILSAIIAFSRLYLFVHYPTDVLAGMLLGIVTGFLGAKIVNSIYEAHANKNKPMAELK